jgi:nitroreductase
MYFDPKKTIELFSLPKNIIPVAFLPIGYPAEDSVPADGHDQKVTMDMILFE